MGQVYQGHLDADSPHNIEPISFRAQRALTPEQWHELFTSVYMDYVEHTIHPTGNEIDRNAASDYQKKDIYLTKFMPLIHYMPLDRIDMNDRSNYWPIRQFLIYIVQWKSSANMLRSLPPFKGETRPKNVKDDALWRLESNIVNLVLKGSQVIRAEFNAYTWEAEKPIKTETVRKKQKPTEEQRKALSNI